MNDINRCVEGCIVWFDVIVIVVSKSSTSSVYLSSWILGCSAKIGELKFSLISIFMYLKGCNLQPNYHTSRYPVSIWETWYWIYLAIIETVHPRSLLVCCGCNIAAVYMTSGTAKCSSLCLIMHNPTFGTSKYWGIFIDEIYLELSISSR